MLRRGVGAGLLAAALLGAAACRDGAVDLGFDPEVGDRYRHRYEIEASVSRAIEGEEPDVTELDTVLIVDQEVVELTPEGARVAVELRRDGGPVSEAVAVLDRAGSLQGVALVEGLAEEALGGSGIPELFGAGIDLPTGELRPGASWEVRGDARSGSGRLDRLGVVDGEQVAVVRSSTTDLVDEEITAAGSTVALEGETTAQATTTYDLADGAVRQAVSSSAGVLDAEIAPPEGVTAEPVPATITYELRVVVRRLR